MRLLVSRTQGMCTDSVLYYSNTFSIVATVVCLLYITFLVIILLELCDGVTLKTLQLLSIILLIMNHSLRWIRRQEGHPASKTFGSNHPHV